MSGDNVGEQSPEGILDSNLRTSQENDSYISALMLAAIKLYLRRSDAVGQIMVESGGDCDLSPNAPRYLLPQTMPAFFVSQLRGQQIANRTSIPDQIAAALLLIFEIPSKNPAQRTGGYPTLFNCHTGDDRRHFFVYAYLDFYMESRTYTIDELLKLRDSFSCASLLRLKTNRDVATIVKEQNNTMASDQNHSKKPNGDVSSSTESDEIIFQGKKQQRVTENPAKNATEWQYRGRADSEVASREPLSAPTGLVAQKSEGFQRFFKAVSSPDHVRVTAGGKIVPNTRGSASPTAKWDKERSVVAGQELAETSRDVKPEGPNASNSINAQLPQLMLPAPYPSHMAYYHHMGLPMPLYPLPHGIPMGFGMLPPNFTQPGMKQLTSVQAQNDTEIAAKAVKTQDGAGDKKPRPAPIKILPRDTTDHSRPYYQNGNVIYPAAYGVGQSQLPMMLTSPYYPPGMVGHPASAGIHSGQPSPAMPMYSPAPIPSPHFYGPLSATSIPRPMQPSSAAKQGFPPHVTSIKPSEITKHQIDSLRTSLKYYEDQLQYNKHQIDEKWVMAQAEKLRQSVQQFEENLKVQVNWEASYYPNEPPNSAGLLSPAWKTSSPHASIRGRRGADTSRNSSASAADRARNPSRFHSSERARFIANRNAKVGINSSKGSSSPLDIDPALEALIRDKMSKVFPTSDATKYGEDAPDAAPTTSASNPYASQPDGGSHGAQATAAEMYDLGDWQSSPVRMPFDEPVEWNGAYTSNTFQTNPTTIANAQQPLEGFVQSNRRQPYLVGTLPRGVTPQNARMMDYVYSRELTEEEKRARSNYWGHVSTAGLGLPKFDGKDFYPPSPVKAVGGTETTSRSVTQPAIPAASTGAEFFQVRPADNGLFNPSRNAQSIRPKENGQRLSKAIPIVAPTDAHRGGKSKTTNQSQLTTQANDGVEGLSDALKSVKITSPTYPSEDRLSQKVHETTARRGLERSSNRSGNDLLQTMLKKGATSGTVLPGAISSTIATGYLPQYHGHAAASLSPAIANAGNSVAVASPDTEDKAVDGNSSQLPAEKVGENCPPNETRSADYDPLKDVQERMLRDAERRGVIGSDW